MNTEVALHQELTLRQKEVLAFFFTFLLEQGAQPGYREIGEAMGFVNRNGAKGHIYALVKKGWLGFPEHRGDSRSMRILRQPDGTPFAGLRFLTTPTLENPLP